MLNNFTPHKCFVKIKPISGKISKIEQNDVTNDIIDERRGMLSKILLPKSTSGYAEQLYFS